MRGDVHLSWGGEGISVAKHYRKKIFNLKDAKIHNLISTKIKMQGKITDFDVKKINLCIFCFSFLFLL
jgi:hypothetical protein